MSNFCVNKKPQPGGEHEVHNLDADCPKYPEPQNQEQLGFHPNCASAVAAAKQIYDDVDGCKFCAPECHTR